MSHSFHTSPVSVTNVAEARSFADSTTATPQYVTSRFMSMMQTHLNAIKLIIVYCYHRLTPGMRHVLNLLPELSH